MLHKLTKKQEETTRSMEKIEKREYRSILSTKMNRADLRSLFRCRSLLRTPIAAFGVRRSAGRSETDGKAGSRGCAGPGGRAGQGRLAWHQVYRGKCILDFLQTRRTDVPNTHSCVTEVVSVRGAGKAKQRIFRRSYKSTMEL